jgi:hypothetical protein
MQAVIARELWLAKMAEPTVKTPITGVSATIFVIKASPK